MLDLIKKMTRVQKQILLLGVDLCLVPLALLCAFAVQEQGGNPVLQLVAIAPVVGMIIVLAAALSIVLGVPNTQLNAYDTRGIGKTAVFAGLLSLAAYSMGEIATLGYGIGTYVVFGVMFFLLSASLRIAMLQLVLTLYRRDTPRCRVLIYGAGTTGLQLAHALRIHKTIEAIAFADDQPNIQGLSISGLPVLQPSRIKELAAQNKIDRVLLAMPSLSPPKLAQIAQRMQQLGLEVQALPSFAQLIGEEALIEKLAPVLPKQLLGRAQLDGEILTDTDHFTGRSVLVSGAGGSIGSELCRQVLACKPARLVLYELSEPALYTIDMELRPLAEAAGTELVPVLGSVTDARMTRKILDKHQIKLVLHAAAYKHVPMVEANPLAGLTNNVLGTATLAQAARAAKVEHFILISSDKAVRPTNVMGASKRLAELVVQDLAARSTDTVFAMVRFGNVLGSSGSVVPLFQSQIARGGPVTLTHSDVTRYFMTVQEAVRLVLQASTFARGGEVFVLDMGAPVPIRKIARQLIEGAGYTVCDEMTPDGDIEIVTTGLRPGEKLHEELLIGEGFLTTSHEKIFTAREARLSEIEVASALRSLRQAVATADDSAARAVIARWVEGKAAFPEDDLRERR